jgi:hypothetical protein
MNAKPKLNIYLIIGIVFLGSVGLTFFVEWIFLINSNYGNDLDLLFNAPIYLINETNLKEDFQQQLNITQLELVNVQDELDRVQALYQLSQTQLVNANTTIIYQESKLSKDQALNIDNLLQDYYNEIRKQYQYFLNTDSQRTTFIKYLIQHDLGKVAWPDLKNNYYSLKGNYPLDDISKKLNFILTDMNYSYNDNNLTKISKTLKWINENIEYSYDLNDVYRSFVETVAFKSGDCDDFGILSSTLLNYIGINTIVGMFSNKDNTQRHVMILTQEYVYGWYYNDLTRFGLKEGNWYVIEPQFTIEQQSSNWVGEWFLVSAENIN